MKTTKELRLEIDTIINALSFGAITSSREVSLALTNAQRAKMWLGKVLEAEGRENPYPQGKNPDSPVIEPQAEHTNDTLAFAPDWDQTAKVKYVRKAMDPIIDVMGNRREESTDNEVAAWAMAWTAIVESQMWLGMELNRIFKTQQPTKDYKA